MNSNAMATFLLLTMLVCVTVEENWNYYITRRDRGPPTRDAEGNFLYFTQKDNDLPPINQPPNAPQGETPTETETPTEGEPSTETEEQY
ncbi:hypothetical protein Y032_0116g551 [Ancylostoma ceylanicum]|nr:hypothetical protein Y032_0116g551 [Ancylostoma ceylanicum]